jgi:hypothetical protein
MICLLSLGRSLRRRHGPLITSGFFSPSAEVEVPFEAPLCGGATKGDFLLSGSEGFGVLSTIASLAGVFKSLVDLEGTSDILLISVPGVGVEAKSLYELSVIRGIFHGNLLNDIQQKIMASDQMSAG